MSQLKSLAADVMRYIEIDMEAFDADYRANPQFTQTLPGLKFKKNELEDLWSNIDHKFRQIRESLDLDDPQLASQINLTKLMEKVQYARNYFRKCMISIDESIEKVTQNTQHSLPEPPVPKNGSVNFNVPPIEIPIFAGDFKSWASFRDLFTAIYYNNTRLSLVEKLFHLKQKTSGEAKEIVDNAPLTNEGFLIAWTQLVSQYENKRMQINAQLKTLFNLPSVNAMSSASIRKLQRQINTCISNLTSLEIDTDNWDPIFVYLCSAKLPRVTRIEFEKTLRNSAEMPSWTDMDEFLTNTYQELISANDIVNSEDHPNTKSHPNPNTHPKPKCTQENRNIFNINGKAFHNVSNSTNNPPNQIHPNTNSKKDLCKLCFNNHNLKDCSTFTSFGVHDRIEFVENNEMCFNCLAISHNVNDCQSIFTCRYCGGRHNTLLHNPEFDPNPQVDIDLQSSKNSIQSFSTQTRSLKPKYSDRTNLLGTVVLNIETQGKLYPARALIDPASDCSFISDKLTKRLRLPTTPIAAKISGLNEIISAHSNQLCEFSLRSNTQTQFKLNIQALVVETLAKNLPTQHIEPTLFENLDNIDLADQNFYNSRPIDIIIGSDFYPKIMKPGFKKDIVDTLLAQETEFGWILTGLVQSTQPITSVTFDKIKPKKFKNTKNPINPNINGKNNNCS